MGIYTLVTFVIHLALGAVSAPQHVHPPAAPGDQSGATTALSADAVNQLLAGDGMGLAKAAELNDYPGPKHVLELKAALGVTPEQERQIEAIRQQMLSRARALGHEIVSAERALDAAFKAGTITETGLAERVGAIARLQGDLRTAHLRAHLATKPLLSAEQVRKYYEHRRAH